MKRKIQIVISLALFYIGSIVAFYHAGQYSARFECDTRYHAHVEALHTNLLGAELEEFFNSKGQDRFADYSINFLTYTY